MRNILIIFTVAFGFTACEKSAGEGGTSVIEGKVIYFEVTFNTSTLQNDTHFYPKGGKDVFILYSDNEDSMYDDKFETGDFSNSPDIPVTILELSDEMKTGVQSSSQPLFELLGGVSLSYWGAQAVSDSMENNIISQKTN